MLKITCKEHDRVLIRTPDGVEIWVEVLAANRRGRRAMIGIVAPQEVLILREALLTREGTGRDS